MPGKSSYSDELRGRAVRMVTEVRSAYSSEWAAINTVAAELGIGSAETLRRWVRQAQSDEISLSSHPNSNLTELDRLRQENANLRRTNRALKRALAAMMA
ncbi:transposase [Nonomuraea wenchangensis]|uniref:transposase n=1 Tax=Nonomuraea wenchangensis TaxID=568860 RepID=UPI003328EE2A